MTLTAPLLTRGTWVYVSLQPRREGWGRSSPLSISALTLPIRGVTTWLGGSLASAPGPISVPLGGVTVFPVPVPSHAESSSVPPAAHGQASELPGPLLWAAAWEADLAPVSSFLGSGQHVGPSSSSSLEPELRFSACPLCQAPFSCSLLITLVPVLCMSWQAGAGWSQARVSPPGYQLFGYSSSVFSLCRNYLGEGILCIKFCCVLFSHLTF